jgi:hypothetical protein
MAAAGAQTVVNFDDLVIPAGHVVVLPPPGYGGVNWPSNAYVAAIGTGHNINNANSAPNAVGFGQLVATESFQENNVTFINGPQIFDGAYFDGGAIYPFTNRPVHFNLYNGTTLVATSALLNLSATPTFLASGYSGPVDRVGIVGDVIQFVMDDFTYTPIPEPSTVGLLALGLLAFGLRRCAGVRR